MKTNIFVNLPVANLEETKRFFKGLGYSFNKQFTDNNAACLIIEDNIYAMLVRAEFFKQFIPKRKITDTKKMVEVAVCLSADSRQQVDDWADKAISLGATENKIEMMEKQDSMYGRSINDLDGHVWEILWMDPKAIQPVEKI